MKTCPTCGKLESRANEPFVGAFCANCYAASHILYEMRERRLSLERCTKCRRIKIRNEWVSPNRSTILHFVKSKIKSPHPFAFLEKTVAEDFVSGNELRCKGTAAFEVGNREVHKDIETVVTLLPTTCTDCSRRSGGYYEAIVQLRGDPLKVEKAAESLGRKINGESFVVKTEVRKEGIDVYAGSDKQTQRILGRMGWTYTKAKKQAGAKNGKTLYRTSYCVRL